MSALWSPCTCRDHIGGASTTFGVHTFTREAREVDLPWRGMEWRWTCSCGARGKWQSQSDNVAYHAWCEHLRMVARNLLRSHTRRG